MAGVDSMLLNIAQIFLVGPAVGFAPCVTDHCGIEVTRVSFIFCLVCDLSEDCNGLIVPPESGSHQNSLNTANHRVLCLLKHSTQALTPSL